MFELFADDPLANTCHENSTLEIFFDSCRHQNIVCQGKHAISLNAMF